VQQVSQLYFVCNDTVNRVECYLDKSSALAFHSLERFSLLAQQSFSKLFTFDVILQLVNSQADVGL